MKIIVAVALMAGIVGSAFGADMPEFPFVFAYGTAVREVAPDMAKVDVQLETYDPSATNALSLLHQRSYEVATMLTTNGVAHGDITAFDIRKEIVRKGEGYEEREVIGYRFTRGFKVLLRDLAAYKRVVGLLRAMPNTGDVTSTFDSKERENISRELIQEAARDAQRRASEIARPFGARVASIHAISERGFSDLGLEFGMGELHALREQMQRMPLYDRSDPFGGQKEDILFLPSTIRFQENITALFRLDNADEKGSNTPSQGMPRGARQP